MLTDDPEFTQQRADYYRDGFRNLQRLVYIETLIIAGMTLFLAFLVMTATDKDRYIAETPTGKKMQMVALPYPNMGNAAITSWVASAAAQIMTFGFNDVDERFALSRQNFTEKGWERFRDAVVRVGIMEDIIKLQQILTATPEGPATLKQEGIVDGKYTWTFEVPLLITVRAGSERATRHKNVTVVVQKISTRDNPMGVGIAEWYL